MTITEKLVEKLKRLDKLNEVLNEWVSAYEEGTVFPEHPEMNTNSFKLERIKETAEDMIEVSSHIEILGEVIREMKEA